MFDDLDLDLDTTPAEPSEDLLDIDLDEGIEYFTKSEAVADLINSQDPDLTYVSRDGIKWEAKSNADDDTKSDWTNIDGFQYLNEYSILEALENMIKVDASLVATITANLL